MEDQLAPTQTALALKGQLFLEQLREAHGIRPATLAEAVDIASRPALPRSDAGDFDLQTALTAVSRGQGYHSARVTETLSVALRNRADRLRPDLTGAAVCQQSPAGLAAQDTQPAAPAQEQPAACNDTDTTSAPPADFVRVYPDLAAAILRTDQAAAARVYFLARALDKPGRGIVAVADLRAAFADQRNPAGRVVSWRRLRELVTAGAGLFWRVDDFGNLRLFGPARIAAALDVARLAGRPVALPTAALMGGIQQFRAALLVCWHAGRQDSAGDAAPITRGKLAELTGVSEASQRTYDKLTHTAARQNYAIGAELGTWAAQKQAYEREDTFVFTDRRGRFGDRGAQYVAWRLPNSYQAELPHMPKGRQRRINSRLTLYQVGQGAADEQTRVFYLDAARACDGYLLASKTLEPDAGRPARLCGAGFWTPVWAAV